MLLNLVWGQVKGGMTGSSLDMEVRLSLSFTRRFVQNPKIQQAIFVSPF